jgi:hypothetical protein
MLDGKPLGEKVQTGFWAAVQKTRKGLSFEKTFIVKMQNVNI